MSGGWLTPPAGSGLPVVDIEFAADRRLPHDAFDLRCRLCGLQVRRLGDDENPGVRPVNAPAARPAMPGAVQEDEVGAVVGDQDPAGLRRFRQMHVVIGPLQSQVNRGGHVMPGSKQVGHNV